VLAAGKARRLDAWPPSKAVHFEAGILAQDPVRRVDQAAVVGLDAGVFVVGSSRLGRIFLGVERLDLPARECSAKLAELAGVLRGEPCV
jgi:hypothetical protein